MTEFEFTTTASFSTDQLVERFIRGQAITNAERAALARQLGGVDRAARMINQAHAAAMAGLADWRNCDGAGAYVTPIGFKRVPRGDYFTVVPIASSVPDEAQVTPANVATSPHPSYFASAGQIAANAERAERACLNCGVPLGLAGRAGQRGNWRKKQFCSEACRKARSRSTRSVRVCPGNAKCETLQAEAL